MLVTHKEATASALASQSKSQASQSQQGKESQCEEHNHKGWRAFRAATISPQDASNDRLQTQSSGVL